MYEKQGFYSGQKLQASQLDAMEDGIIEAQEGVRNICYEDNAYEPITWDGVIGDREKVDVSHLMEAEAGTVYAVKLSDKLLTREDYIESVYIIYTSEGIIEDIIQEDWLPPAEQDEEFGAVGLVEAIITVTDTDKINAAAGTKFQTTGVYALCAADGSVYLQSLSKTTIKKIDEKFLPELADASNMEKGTGTNATQQLPHSEKMTTQEGVIGFDTGTKNGYVNGFYPYGAVGPYSATLNGRSSAQGEYSLSANSQTAAPGNYATSLGYATVAGGDCSFAGGSGTYAASEGAVALGMKTKAAAAYATAIGSNTQALADCALSGGIETAARGQYSVALGKGNVASYAGQTVIGMYNKLAGNNEAIKTLFTVGSGINHETQGILRDDALRILDNRAVIFFPIKGTVDDIEVEPICLQDVLTIAGQQLERLNNAIINLQGTVNSTNTSLFGLQSTTGNLQIQINDLQADIRNISAIITNLQTRVSALESK